MRLVRGSCLNSGWRAAILGLAIVGFLVTPGAADEAAVLLMVESDTDLPEDEVSWGQYVDIPGFVAGSLVGNGFTAQNVNSVWGFHGFAAGESEYYILLESDADEPGGAEIYIMSYASLADVLANTYYSTAFSAVNISSSYSVAGFASDGTRYYVLLESDTDVATEEFYLWYFDSIADVVSWSGSAYTLSLNLTADWSVGGLASDGERYYLICETDAGMPTGQELFVWTYASITDLVNHTPASGSFSNQSLSDTWSMGGMASNASIFGDDFETNGLSAWSAVVP